MIAVHKIALDPTVAQRILLARSAGTARFAFNWALDEWQRQYEAGQKPSEAALRRQLNTIKRTEFPWMLEVSKVCAQQAIKNLGTAFDRFFKKLAKYPRRKKKGQHDSFRADNGPGTVETDGKCIRIPKLGRLRMREELRFSGEIKSVVVSRRANRWFAAVAVDTEDITPCRRENQTVVGVDLGVSAMATLSDGTVVCNPMALRRGLQRLRRLSRVVSRRKRGSANRKKAVWRLARMHARISDVRQDALHKATTMIARKYGTVVIEDLNVSGILKNERLSRAIADVGLYDFRRQLEYKTKWYGGKLVVADRWFPSSKRCSWCGHVLEVLPLNVREWECPECHDWHDRDQNAAVNLQQLVVLTVKRLGRVQAEDTPVESGGPWPEQFGQVPLIEAGTNELVDSHVCP